MADLTDVEHITTEHAATLREEHDIESVGDLARASQSTVQELSGIGPAKSEDILLASTELMSEETSELADTDDADADVGETTADTADGDTDGPQSFEIELDIVARAMPFALQAVIDRYESAVSTNELTVYDQLTGLVSGFTDAYDGEGVGDDETITVTLSVTMDELNLLNQAFSAKARELRSSRGTNEFTGDIKNVLSQIGEHREANWGN
ncbi:helix-hairpin-helix domain-containing protein [Halosegnis longus]|uniref:helix-hairpin-helix domain-containing protein n=1 Tax=Halosegnis longus TaxID=2216012 RepID=UPI001562C846|nr:helix-hairpin-helix domain-containing protein [Halosegnis longus]